VVIFYVVVCTETQF